MQYVYILLCSDGETYVGCSSDLKDRFQRHKYGYVLATKSRLPVKLVFYCAFVNKFKAFEFENYLKAGNGRIFLK
jgi:predicted GIY-YIG superfamily endonuclease